MSIIINNAIVIEDPIEGRYSRDLSVLVDREVIKQVGPRDELAKQASDAEMLNGAGMFLLPGLIDAHTHLYAALTMGMPSSKIPPRNFPEVLERIWWSLDRVLQEEDLEISAQVGALASLRSGITTVLDHHSSPSVVPDSLSRISSGIESVGLRACLAYEVSDRDGKEVFEQQVRENLRFSAELAGKKDSLIAGMFGLHAVFSLSDASLQRCAEEAADHGLGCHMHMVEHLTEIEKFSKDHQVSIAEFLKEIGILGPKSLVAHTVHVNRKDIEILKETGTFNVHNPQSNMGNGVGIAPIQMMLDQNQPVGLGSDGYYNLPLQITLARLLQIIASGDPSGFSELSALKLAYRNNSIFAEKIFRVPFGKIMQSYAADLVLIDYQPATPIEKWNIHSHIIAALNSGRVRTAFVGGKPVLKDNVVLGVDEESVKMTGRMRARDLWTRL